MPTTRVGIAVEGIPSIRKALTAVGDGAWLTKSMDEIGRDGRVDIQMDAPRHLINNVGFIGVRGEGTATRAMFKVSAPDAARQEFGRAPKPYRSRGSKKGKRATYNLRSGGYVYKGSKPRPYVGLKNRDHAIAKIQASAPPTIWRHLLDAWNARGGE